MNRLISILLLCLFVAGCHQSAPKKHVGTSTFYAWPNSGPPFPGDTNHYAGTNGYWPPPNDWINRTNLYLTIGLPYLATNSTGQHTNINIGVANSIVGHRYTLFWTRKMPLGSAAAVAVVAFTGSTNLLVFTNTVTSIGGQPNKFWYTVDSGP
jgi:hypothetical protein